jgi:hypothetical protein
MKITINPKAQILNCHQEIQKARQAVRDHNSGKEVDIETYCDFFMREINIAISKFYCNKVYGCDNELALNAAELTVYCEGKKLEIDVATGFDVEPIKKEIEKQQEESERWATYALFGMIKR